MVGRKIFAGTAPFVIALAIGSAQADAIDDYVTAQMRKQHIPGLALAVIRDGKAIKVQGYGLANVETNTPAKPDSVFKIGSVSKQFIATGVMVLVNDGKVAVDDKIGKYLEGSPEIWQDITVRHVLTHTSGLVRESPGFSAMQAQSDAEVIKAAYQTPLRFQPGEKFEYCNLGYFILAEIIRKASGQEWPAFMEQRVFKPLGMNDTRTTDMTAVIPRRADGYVYSNGKLQNGATVISLRPSGAFISTANDLVKWNAALDSGTVLPKPVLEQMWTRVKLNDGTEQPYGFGWYLDKAGTHSQVRHGGSLAGFRSEYTRLTDDNLSVIVLTNVDGARTDAIAVNVAANYIKDLLPKRTAAKVDPEALAQYTGRYQFAPGYVIEIVRQGGGLSLEYAPMGQQIELRPLSDASFFAPDDTRAEYVFVKDAAGAVTHISVRDGGNEISRATRVP